MAQIWSHLGDSCFHVSCYASCSMCSTSAVGSNAKRISTWYAFALGAAFDVISWFEIIQNFLRNDEILVLPIYQKITAKPHWACICVTEYNKLGLFVYVRLQLIILKVSVYEWNQNKICRPAPLAWGLCWGANFIREAPRQRFMTKCFDNTTVLQLFCSWCTDITL